MVTRGKLTDDQMDILERWIGKGSKTFTLLYAITRDGCNSTTFHQKCDNQGPTVTVLYNQQGSVYGRYAAVSWQSNNACVTTADSFLFKLRSSGYREIYEKFITKLDGNKHSMYCNASYGPTFGCGNNGDLVTFSGSVQNTDGFVPLNGSMNNFGKGFNTQGITSDKVNDGSMNVTELEVYKVSDGQRQKTTVDLLPWRKTKIWNDQA